MRRGLNLSSYEVYRTYILSTCPLHTISGYGKREAHINWSMVKSAKAALHTISGYGKREAHINWSMVKSAKAAPFYWNYLENYWPCAGGLSAMNAIDMQLRDPINSGLTRWRMAVKINKWTPPRKSGGIPWVSTRFSLSMEMNRLTRDGTAEPVSRDQILRREGVQGNMHFLCSADNYTNNIRAGLATLPRWSILCCIWWRYIRSYITWYIMTVITTVFFLKTSNTFLPRFERVLYCSV